MVSGDNDAKTGLKQSVKISNSTFLKKVGAQLCGEVGSSILVVALLLHHYKTAAHSMLVQALEALAVYLIASPPNASRRRLPYGVSG